MAKRKNNKPKPPDDDPDELRKIYEKLRREFTAADLQRYTVEEEGIPMEEVLAKCEAIHRQETQKRKKKGR